MPSEQTHFTCENYRRSADFIANALPCVPETALILGSGLGGFTDAMRVDAAVKYADIPDFPRSTTPNHRGELVCGTVNGAKVLAMSGRFHFYEGYSMEQCAYPVSVFSLLGVKNLIATNAAGGINRDYERGALVCVTDHIKLAPDSPMRGANVERLGPRFFDMQSAYAPELRELAHRCADAEGIALRDGVYAYMAGPQFETRAEIVALQRLGADLVGMSTVAEIIAAAHCGMRAMCISCVTNMAAGIAQHALTHEEVLEAGKMVEEKFARLITRMLGEM